MMTIYLDFLMLIVSAFITGLVSSQVAKGLDFAMDYGHLLDWFRIDRVKASAKKTKFDLYFQEEFSKRLEIGDFGERLEAMDELYWTISLRDKNLTLWLCSKCLSHRINFAFSTAWIVGASFAVGFSPAFLIFYLISFSINQIYISK